MYIIMTKLAQFTSAFLLLSILPALGCAQARPIENQGSCQAALASLADQWSAAGLAMPPAGPLGGIEAKPSTMVKAGNGYATSLANLQYMPIELHAASAACQAGDTGTALEKVALVRNRLDAIGH